MCHMSVCLSVEAVALRHEVVAMYIEFITEIKKKSFEMDEQNLNRTAFSSDV